MTALQPGALVFRKGGDEIDDGALRRLPRSARRQGDRAGRHGERSDEIDATRAEEARRRAQTQLATREGEMDIAMVMAALERAQARLRVVERRRRRGADRGAPRPTAQQPPQQN